MHPGFGTVHFCSQPGKTELYSSSRPLMLYMRQYLGFLKGLLQDVVDILVNLVQLVLLDVALLQQTLGILLVGVLMSPDRLHKWVLCHGQKVMYWCGSPHAP